MYQNQIVFFDITLYLCSMYSALVIHMFLKEGKLAKILPPSQHIVSLLGGARHLHLASVGRVLFIYLMNLSGNPSIIVLPPANTISLYKVFLRSISTLERLFANNCTTAKLKQIFTWEFEANFVRIEHNLTCLLFIIAQFNDLTIRKGIFLSFLSCFFDLSGRDWTEFLFHIFY